MDQMEKPKDVMEGLSPEVQKAMRFFGLLTKDYGQSLDDVAKEPFFVAAAQNMNLLTSELKKKAE